MRGKRNHVGLYILLGLILSAGILNPKMITFAGEINSHEAGVIAAASGTFSYNGKTYRAGSAYINSLTAYLAADDVDLTAEQASKAISMMYANVENGVARGYLYEVNEGQPGATTEQSGTTTEQSGVSTEQPEATTEQTGSSTEQTESSTEQSEATTEQTKEQTDKQPGDKEETGADKESQYSDGDVDIWEAMSNESEAKEKLENRPEKDDASASVRLEENDIVITTKENEQFSIPKKEQLIPNKVLVIIDIAAGCIFAIVLICGVILFLTKCMSFKKHKSRRARPGHSRRRKIRRHTRNTLTVTTTISIIGIFILLGSYVSLFNKDATMQSMQSSGYFRYAYSQYISELAEERDLDGIVTYDEYLFTIKQNSLKILDGETNIKIPDTNVTPYIYNMKQSYMKMFSIAGVFIILSTVFGIVLMIFMDQRRERGIKHIAVAELIASGIMAAITGIMVVSKVYSHLYIEPDYLYLFLMECINWTMKVMTSIVAFGVGIGMILVGVYKSISDNRSES